MTAEDMTKKLNMMPHGTTMYIYYNHEFLPIDCIRYNKEDEEAVILPIKDFPPDTKK